MPPADRPRLRPLPSDPSEYAAWCQVRVPPNLCIAVDGHDCPLPHALASSVHSPRVGSAEDLATADVSRAAILPAAGWAAARMIKRDLRHPSALKGVLAQLLAGTPTAPKR